MLGLGATSLVYLTQVIAGWLCVAALRGDGSAGWQRGPGMWARVLLLGPGALAVQMLAYDALGIPFRLALVLLPWWLWWALVLLRRGRRRSGRWRPDGAWQAVAVGLATALVAVAAAATACSPVHSGDELGNFAVNARFFAAHGGLAPAALVGMVDPSHNEYPPLVALNEALLFLADQDLAPWAVRPFFAAAHLALALLVVEALWCAAAPRASLALCALVIAAPEIAERSATGTPDVRLTASVLMLGLGGLELGAGGGRAALRFAIAAGLCGVTKNEGIAIGAVAFALLLWRGATGTAAARGARLRCAVVAAVLVGAWPVFRWAHGIREQFLADARQHLDVGAALVRVPRIAEAWASCAFGSLPGGSPRWGALWGVALLLGALALRWPETRRVAAGVLACLVLHLGVYTAVFAVTPFDLDWHLGTAADRLLMHATPWLVLLMALRLRAAPL